GVERIVLEQVNHAALPPRYPSGKAGLPQGKIRTPEKTVSAGACTTLPPTNGGNHVQTNVLLRCVARIGAVMAGQCAAGKCRRHPDAARVKLVVERTNHEG